MTQRREVGQGSLFRQPGCGRWYLQYYIDGRRVREKTGTTSKRKAQDILTERLSQVRRGEWLAPRKPPRVEELFTALEDHVKVHRPSSLRDLYIRWGKQDKKTKQWRGHLHDAFANTVANNLSPDLLTAYARKRKEEGAADASVNREFATLRRMFNLAHQSNRISRVPHFPMLQENNVRKGFVEDADFERLVATANEPWLRTFLELAFTYGWRRGELLGLRVRQVNLNQRTIRLDPGTTKNREGREVAMTPKVLELLRLACEGKQPEDHVLTRDIDGLKAPVKDFRDAWRNVCLRAGLAKLVCRKCNEAAALELEVAYQCPKCKATRRDDFRYEGLIPHDMRRSAAKALRRAGVAESVIMATGGWRTAAMFRRYAIVSSADSQDAMEALERARTQRATMGSFPARRTETERTTPN